MSVSFLQKKNFNSPFISALPYFLPSTSFEFSFLCLIPRVVKPD